MTDEEDRCSVCLAKRKGGGNHLRIEVCRPCAIFFRRASHNGIVLTCRTGKDECKLDRDNLYPCKKCRYEKIRQTFSQLLRREAQSRPSPSNGLEWNYETMSDRENVSYYLDELRPLNVSPMLRKFRKCYNDLCRKRLVIEFGSLEGLPVDFMFEATSERTPTSIYNYFMRRVFHEVFHFLNVASEEFAVMMPDYKMKLFAKFAKMWVPFECGYRTLKYFLHHENKMITTFGRYIDVSAFANIFPGFTNNRFKDEATRMMQEMANKTYAIGRTAMTRLNLSDEEYVAVTAILLWNFTNESSVSDDLSDVADKNKMMVLHDLYKYYRSIGLRDYSARLGEILAFLQLLENLIEELARLMEALRVLGVVDEETYNQSKITMQA